MTSRSRSTAGAVGLLLAPLLVFGPVAEPAHASQLTSTSGAGSDEQPSLDEMNSAGDHQMGSTIEQFEGTGPAGRQQADSQSPPVPQTLAPNTHVLGMDVSGWQPNVDWNAAWSNGARFVYIKATESNDYASSHFSKQYDGATDAGFVRGAYHFANPHESSGATQANWFVNHGGGWSADGITLPPMLDIEYDPYTGSDGTDSCWGLNPAQMSAWIQDFTSTVRSRTGVQPVIYTTTGWWNTCTGNNASFGGNPLFIARWRDEISNGPGNLPAGWTGYALWQYSNGGVFPGDQDLFNGDYTSLHLFASNGATPAGGPSLDGNYITSLYRDYLDRAPSPSDINWWEAGLATGSPRSSISDGFVNSDEYRILRIHAAYRQILGRPAEPGGQQSWLSGMKRGILSTDDIETSLYASDEYYQQHGSTDISYAEALYTELLERQGTPNDYAFWAALVARHGRGWVISQFWNSPETISGRVSALYQRYLGRVPDAGGLRGWVAVALEFGDSGLRSGFTSSQEYFNRAQQ